ncbi:MAG: NADH-quinone oxidoreductase subunit C [Chloroflexi bacterium]|nr:NADH-quinone oxidoreductase subunit C [Chloroflexota bacterium]
MSTDRNELVKERVAAAFPSAILEVVDFRDTRTLVINQKEIKPVIRFLRDNEDLRYNFISDICADDMLPELTSGEVEDRFAVNYHLLSMSNKHRLRLRVPVEDPDNGPETITDLWPVAEWLEMEVWDLMGIRFKGNDDLRRLFLPEDWQGHPLRKDYPLGYEEVQFSFNFEAIDAKKPYAKD